MARKKIVQLVFVFLFAGILARGGDALAQANPVVPDGTSMAQTDVPASPYNAHRLKKPAWFEDLVGYVLATHSADPDAPRHVLLQTLQPAEIPYGKDKGKPAVTYVSYELDQLTLNTLVDSGRYLNLYTLVNPELDDLLLPPEDFSASENAKASACDACNCVTWVRCAKASWLPYGLFTLADKKRVMNSSSADPGKVAVHNIYYPYGHVSYITKVKGSTIYIEEANYSRCKVTKRSGSKSNLKIIGYIKKK